jgi:hypothetical protein
VAEFRKALERFNGRGQAIDYLLAETQRERFDEGITGLIFTGDWQRPGLHVQPRLSTGLRILFATPGLSAQLDEHRQIYLTLTRLEALKRQPEVRANPALMARLEEGLDGLYVFRGLFQAAAREWVINTLTTARAQTEELAVAASLGISQSVLFDSTGRSSGTLVFGAGR